MHALNMKVLHINTERTWRGGEQQTLYLASGLHARGIPTALACPPGTELEHRGRQCGVAVHPVKMRGEWDLPAVLALRKIIKKEGFDLVHMHTSHAHTLGVAAAGFGKTAKTVVSRRVDFSIYRHPFSLSGFKYRFGVTRYIAISQAIMNQLGKDGIPADRISLVHSGIDLARFSRVDGSGIRTEFKIDPKAFLVGTVAHFAWHKGLHHLLDAFRRARKELPHARLLLVGDGELFEEIKAKAVANGLSDTVIFPGFRKDIPEAIQAMDLFVMPSTMEGLCTSILDALALEKPVIGSRVGGIPEILLHEESGLLVPPKDPEALAKAILRLARNPDLARELGRRGRLRVEEMFSAEAMVEGVLEVYRSVLEEPS
jgi:glycosyltransferase involved in cell wall biosynthesis